VHTPLRISQALYNQVVYVLEEHAMYVKIWIPGVRYDKDFQPLKNSFWALKSCVQPLQDLCKSVKQAIPDETYGVGNTIVLTYPWKDYSIGSRFVYIPHQSDTTKFTILKPDFTKNKVAVAVVPREYAITEIMLTPKKQRRLFIQILESLLYRLGSTYGVAYEIAYVWGGSSFVQPYRKNCVVYQGNDIQRESLSRSFVATGFDCSSLVMRIAQIVGIHFPWKTTVMMHHALQKVAHRSQLQVGDLIWMPGHVMIVSNIEKHEVIEARGYKSGYGRLHKMQLEQLFDHVKTYDDLFALSDKNKQIVLKDKNGNFYLKTQIKFLRLVHT
jgi:hypothetical protein